MVDTIFNHIDLIVSVFGFLIILLLSWVSLFLLKFKQSESKISNIVSIETANDNFLPVYLGYFFVALSIDNVVQFISVFLLIGLLIYHSKVSYFNPIFLLFGYKYYNFSKNTGVKQLFITKEDILDIKSLDTIDFKRINNYTFINI